MVYSYKYLCLYFKCNRFSSSIFGFDIFDCLTPSGINRQNMTVQELIDKLSKVEDKTMEVNFPYSHGTQENGQPMNVDSVSVFDDCVVIY